MIQSYSQHRIVTETARDHLTNLILVLIIVSQLCERIFADTRKFELITVPVNGCK